MASAKKTKRVVSRTKDTLRSKLISTIGRALPRSPAPMSPAAGERDAPSHSIGHSLPRAEHAKPDGADVPLDIVGMVSPPDDFGIFYTSKARIQLRLTQIKVVRWWRVVDDAIFTGNVLGSGNDKAVGEVAGDPGLNIAEPAGIQEKRLYLMVAYH